MKQCWSPTFAVWRAANTVTCAWLYHSGLDFAVNNSRESTISFCSFPPFQVFQWQCCSFFQRNNSKPFMDFTLLYTFHRRQRQKGNPCLPCERELPLYPETFSLQEQGKPGCHRPDFSQPAPSIERQFRGFYRKQNRSQCAS